MASRSAKSADKPSTKKPKLIRDSFSIPKSEFAAIDALKTRAIALGTSVKKSELLRAGLMALQAMGDSAFKTALAAVPTLKTGRPAAEPPELPAKTTAKGAGKAAAKAPSPTRAAAKAKAPAKATRKAPAPKPPAAKPPAAKAPAARKSASRRAA